MWSPGRARPRTIFRRSSEAVLEAGADIIQLREKDAEAGDIPPLE